MGVGGPSQEHQLSSDQRIGNFRRRQLLIAEIHARDLERL